MRKNIKNKNERDRGMTIQGAIAELQNLVSADDIPFYYKNGIKKVIETIQMDLPIEPKRPKGKWIFNPKDAIDSMFAKPKCNKCGFESADGGNFCPNCGADMKGADDD